MVLLTPHKVILTQTPGGLDPIRKSHFRVEIQDDRGKSAPDLVQYLVKSFDPPEKAVEVRQSRGTNHYKTYPGARQAITSAPLIIRCMTTSGGGTRSSYRFFNEWFNRIYDSKTDSVGLVSERNMGKVELVALNVDQSPFSSVALECAWPSRIKLDSGDYENDGDCLEFTVTFECGDVIYQFE